MNKHLGRTWEEAERELFTPEEIAESKARVALMIKNIEAEKIGYVTHEKSTIQHFMKEPEYADHLMSVVAADGDEEEIAYFQNLYDEARVRSRVLEVATA